ncbi:hypothetical protein B0H21DRAFT_824229 [Amylocystis lapponica]|nr:hypothetical protein B0H21DRAFT_824229 [Amylocystis lapponica]
MVSLGAPEALLNHYKVLRQEDLKVSTAVADPNMRGQRATTMAWFWTMDIRGDAEGQAWMEEFYRINWIKAKSRYDRVREEHDLLKHEILWTNIFFVHQSEAWINRMRHRAFAGKQADMFKALADEASALHKFTMNGQ